MTLSSGLVLNNRYRIVKLLGQGGFGAVYRAWDLNLEAPRAIKENLDTSPEAQRQFKREAQILDKLFHPNLPRVIDHFIIPGQGQYLVMDFVEGADLDETLERAGGPLLETQVLPCILQVCDALSYLHSQTPPVIHRDVKPANIKITPEGKAMLVDFGIAKIFDPHLSTTVGARAVTPGYSPPEQYGMGATDACSDVYALGATLYHLLSGVKLPASVDIVSQSVPPPLPVIQMNPAVSPAVSAAVERATQVGRMHRYQSVLEFKAALLDQATLETTPVVSVAARTSLSPATPPVAVARRRFPWRAALGALAALLAVAVVILGGQFAWRELQNRSVSETALAPLDLSGDIVAPQSTAVSTPTITSPPPSATPADLEAQLSDSYGVPISLVPSGRFLMGSPAGESDERPLHEIQLDAFYIDIYEVTNGLYSQCVQAGVCAPPSCGDYLGPEMAQHPVICVDWRQANTYCEWREARLPTEAEWEKAARGGLAGSLYPWGDEAPVCTPGQVNGANFDDCSPGGAMPVGSFAPNAYGLYDMAGNVSEWVADWYDDNYYRRTPPINPQGPGSGTYRIMRGGSWNNHPDNLRVARRYSYGAALRRNFLGFRCASSP